MAKQKSTDDKRTDVQPGEAALTRVYRNARAELPPPALDQKILARAREALNDGQQRGGFTKRWAVPVSIAALVVLSVSVVVQISIRDESDYRDSAPALTYSPMAKSVAPEPSPKKAEAPAEMKRSAPSAAPAAPPAPMASAPSATAERKRDNAAEAEAGAAQSADRMAPMRDQRLAAGLAKQKAETSMDKANVISVNVSGRPGAYEFDVGIRSPDTGCQQYADWWEVVSEDGKLLYRRVLLHSHVDEQPFARSGGPVPIQPDTIVLVRAHMNTSGYGGNAFKGSVAKGFTRTELAPDFASALAKQQPLPQGCDF